MHALIPGRLAVPFGLLAAVTMLAAGCSSSGGGSTSAGGGPSSSTAAGTATTIKVTNGYLTDDAGRTVYLWVADTGSTSTCSGECASVWPAVTTSGAPVAGAGANASTLGTTMRSDGTRQVTYNGHPLYFYASDANPGQTTGQGSNSFGAKWWELDAAGKAITTGASTSGSPSSSGSSAGGGGGYGY